MRVRDRKTRLKGEKTGQILEKPQLRGVEELKSSKHEREANRLPPTFRRPSGQIAEHVRSLLLAAEKKEQF